MFSRSDLQAAVPNVLQRLREITDLPTHGTVAGQAVASMFFEELNLDMCGPVNDVDVFVSVSAQYNAVPSTLSKFSSEQDKYNHVKFISSHNNLSIVSTSTENALNMTTITYPGACDEQIHSKVISQTLVDGFDLNGVAVGINLHSEEVVCTAEFLRFLDHREMKVVSTMTPAHTLVRLARKMFSGQLKNITCNYQLQRERLEQFMFLLNHSSFSKHITSVTGFGARYKECVERFQTHLPAFSTNPLRNDLFVFDVPSTPQRETLLLTFLPLVENLGDGATAFLFHYNFDRLFDVVTHHDFDPSDFAQLVALSQTKGMSDGEILSQVNQFLGGQPLVYPIGLDDNDCAVLLLGYDDRDDPFKTQKTLNIYTALSAFEKEIFAVENDLNIVEEIAQHPLNWAHAQLQRYEGSVFAKWGQSFKTSYDAQLFVLLMERVGTDQQLREQLAFDFLEHSMGVTRHTFNLLTHLPINNQIQAFESIIEHIYLGFDKIVKLKSAEQQQFVLWAHHNNVDVAPLLSMMDSQHIVSFLTLNKPLVDTTTKQLNNIAAALALISDDALMDNSGHVLRHLLHEQYLPVVHTRVSRIDSQLWTSRWIKNVDIVLSETDVQYEESKKSIFENIVLFREVGYSSCSTVRRKI